jgi:hypothetical protein
MTLWEARMSNHYEYKQAIFNQLYFNKVIVDYVLPGGKENKNLITAGGGTKMDTLASIIATEIVEIEKKEAAKKKSKEITMEQLVKNLKGE